MNFLSESEEAIWSFVVLLLPRKKTFKDGTKLTQVIQPKLHLMTIHFPITWLLDRISLYAPCWQTQETLPSALDHVLWCLEAWLVSKVRKL
jgi:hypothetical protein